MGLETERLRSIWSENSYYSMAEIFIEEQWEGIIWPRINGFDFSNVVDLAAGHGRNSKYLVRHSDKLTIVDLCRENIVKCRKRFAKYPNVDYKICDGKTIPVDSCSVSLLYCFDAMVHFEPETVRFYLCEAQRIMTRKAKAFLHHSNYQGFCNVDFRKNPHARNFMSKNLFQYWARKCGFKVLSSEIINWGNSKNLDCITILEKQ